MQRCLRLAHRLMACVVVTFAAVASFYVATCAICRASTESNAALTSGLKLCTKGEH